MSLAARHSRVAKGCWPLGQQTESYCAVTERTGKECDSGRPSALLAQYSA